MTQPAQPSTSARDVQKVFAVGPKSLAQRVGLAAWLAVAGIATVAVSSDEAHAQYRTSYGSVDRASGLSAQEIFAPQTLSPQQWEQKMAREGHGQAGALLTDLYQHLAAPISLSRDAQRDQDVAATMVVRAQWIKRLNGSVAPGQVHVLIDEFQRDMIRASGCGEVTMDQQTLLGFDDRSWNRLIDTRRGIGQTVSSYHSGRAPGTMDIERAQARLDTHARNLGVRWLRAPWEASHDATALAAVEQDLVHTHMRLKQITNWSFSPVGLKGRAAWDLASEGGAVSQGYHVTIRGGADAFPVAWLNTVQHLASRVPAQTRQAERYNSASAQAGRVLNTLIGGAIRGQGSEYVDYAVRDLTNSLPNRILNARRDRQNNGYDIMRVDAGDFQDALHSNSGREVAMWQATFRDIPYRVLNVDQHNQMNMGCARPVMR